MLNFEQVDWAFISHQELDMLLRLRQSEIVNLELQNHLTPLCMACKLKREDLVTVLLHHGAQTNKASSHYNRQPLHFACTHDAGNLGVVRKLLQADAHIDALDEDGNTGLHFACSEKNVLVAELLIGSGADVNLADVDGETPLIRACFAESIELIDILLKTGSDPNICGGRALEIAVLNSSVEAIELLITAGVDINQGDYLGLASEHNHFQIMRILQENGIDVNRCNSLGMTPLQTACLSDNADPWCVSFLLQWGAEVNAVSTFGLTPICNAVIRQSLTKIRLLLAHGADVNKNTSQMLSSIFMCFRDSINSENSFQMVRLLLAAGIKLNLENLDHLKLDAANFLLSAPGKRELLDLLDTHKSQPLSLQSLCRVGIRSCMKSNVDANMKTLPLPSHIIKFLNFQDISEALVK